MSVRTITVEFHGDDATFDRYFQPVPSSAHYDQGMTQNEVIADWFEQNLVPEVLRIPGIQVVVRP